MTAPAPTKAAADPIAAAESLASEITARYHRYLMQKTAVGPWASNRASGLGDPCMRRVVLWRTKGEQAAPFTESTAGFFTAGSLYEGPVLRLIEELGIRLDKGQLALPKNDYQIGSRIDRSCTWEGIEMPIEMKTCGRWVFDSIEEARDVREHSSPFVRKYYDQVQIYLMLGDWPVGLLILWDKEGGRLKPIPVPLDTERAEWLLDRADAINAHMKAGTLPAFIQDAAECRKCPFFGRACNPELDFGPGTRVIADEALIADAELREKSEPAHREFEAADKRIKAALRGVEHGILGPFQILGKWGKQSRVELPEELKKQYTVTDERGRFTMKIERIA